VKHDIVDAVILPFQAIKMEVKLVATEKYDFIKLLDNMPANQAELARRSGVNERTIIRVKNGEAILRGTANKILRGLSQIYGESFTLDNVSGINISDR
jgi:predicted transcriptional regulator